MREHIYNKTTSWQYEMILRCIGRSRFLLLSAPSCDNMSSATDIFQITIIAKQLSTNPPSFCDTLQMWDYFSETLLFERYDTILGWIQVWQNAGERKKKCHYVLQEATSVMLIGRSENAGSYVSKLVFAQICDFFTRIGAIIKITF